MLKTCINICKLVLEQYKKMKFSIKDFFSKFDQFLRTHFLCSAGFEDEILNKNETSLVDKKVICEKLITLFTLFH